MCILKLSAEFNTIFYLTHYHKSPLTCVCMHARIQTGDNSLKNHKYIGFLSNTGPASLENH